MRKTAFLREFLLYKKRKTTHNQITKQKELPKKKNFNHGMRLNFQSGVLIKLKQGKEV